MFEQKGKEMQPQLSRKKASLHIIFVALFYLISGAWEYLLGVTDLEATPSGIYAFLDMYRGYMLGLGEITIIIGILLLFKFNFIRVCAISLAWWNIVTIPLISISMDICAATYIKTTSMESLPGVIASDLLLAMIYTAIRLYIIKMLNISKAGYIFLRNKPELKTG